MSKYFKYAIGEIFLVMVGILLALQVNNWNESRKERITEQKILKELLVDLEISKLDLVNDVNFNIQSLATSEALIKHLYNKEKYHDSIEEMLLEVSSITQFTPRTSGYKNLNVVGLNIIQNDSLRTELTNVFERNFEYAAFQGRVLNRGTNSRDDISPFINKHFGVDMTITRQLTYTDNSFTYETHDIKIRNYDAFLNDEDLPIMIQKTIYDRGNKVSVYNITIKAIDELSQLIKDELDTF